MSELLYQSTRNLDVTYLVPKYDINNYSSLRHFYIREDFTVLQFWQSVYFRPRPRWHESKSSLLPTLNIFTIWIYIKQRSKMAFLLRAFYKNLKRSIKCNIFVSIEESLHNFLWPACLRKGPAKSGNPKPMKTCREFF